MKARQLSVLKIPLCILLSLTMAMACKKKDQGTSTGNPFSLSIASSSQTATIVKNTFKNNTFERWLNILLSSALALPPPASMTDSSGATVNLSQAWIVLSEIELKTTQNSDVSEALNPDISFAGPFAIDLFNTSSSPIGQSTSGLSEIRRIKMKYSKLDPANMTTNTPEKLSGNSLLLSGTITSNGSTKSFTVLSSEESQYEVGGPQAITLGSGTSNNLLLSIKIASLIRSIDLSNITSNGTEISENNRLPVSSGAASPCPTIDSSAADVYTCFKKGLESIANLGVDSNGNGELDLADQTIRI